MAGLFALLLMGFAGASYGAVRFDVVQSPTEVVNTGRSEVQGSVTLNVNGATGNVTGTSANGNAQIGLIYTNPALQIDNTTTTGIRIFFSTGFIPANPAIVDVANRDINGKCSGFLSINLLPGAAVSTGDFIRIEGVRGRVDLSLAQTPGTDLFVDLQSINDPSANTFNPDRVRVSKSLDGMNVAIVSDTLLLCFPTLGKPAGSSQGFTIRITEGFARAFVDFDSNNDSSLTNDRTDSGGPYTTNATAGTVGPPPVAGTTTTPALLGNPTNSTQFLIWVEQIPTSVSGIVWPSTSSNSGISTLVLIATTFDATSGTATATYSYEAVNQVGLSDITFETFNITPTIVIKANNTVTGNLMTAVTLAPAVPTDGTCRAPGGGNVISRPRFFQMWESDAVATNNPPDDPHRLLASIIRCNCFLLFTYVTATSAFNTGIVVANTTGDVEVFGSLHAPDQLGKITFYYYDRSLGYVGSFTTSADITQGKSYVELLSGQLPTGVTSFSGYVFAKAEFQFCHGFAFIADSSFASIAHGYVANVVPDPAIKFAGALGGVRTAADAGDATNIPAGEGLNN
jgi:hypothetical protein